MSGEVEPTRARSGVLIPIRPADEPEGEKCGFCGKKNDWFDDIGFFYILPYPQIKEQLAACRACYQGDPGRRHIARFGMGER